MADAATGVAAIWRSDAALQQWRRTRGDAAAAASLTQGAVGVRQRAGPAAAALGMQPFARLLADVPEGDEAGHLMALAVCSSLIAANKLTLQLSETFKRQPVKQPACKAIAAAVAAGEAFK
jgi:hypothetical protein